MNDAGKAAGPRAGPDTDLTALNAAVWVRSAALSGILLLMVLYTMYATAALLIPIALAFVLNMILSPVVRLLSKVYLPKVLAAFLIVGAVTTAMAGGVYALADPAMEWMERAPAELERLESKLSWVTEPVRDLRRAGREVEDMAGTDAAAGGAPAADPVPFSLVGTFLSGAPSILFGGAVTLILLFFLLASGDELLNKSVQIAPLFKDKRRVVETGRDIQRHVSAYLGTTALINVVVGTTTGLAMDLLNVPNPALWGVMVGVLKFIPYLGVAISMVVVGLVSLLTFDSALEMVLPLAAVFAINVIEGQFLTPILAGRRLSLSPVAVFLGLVVMGWIWGIAGVLIATPLLAAIKLVCEQIEPVAFIATFLGSDH